jgi:predicted alpha/beta-fold hydrolase
MFHGLEGSSRSHYIRSCAHEAHAAGWHVAVPHFRGCSGELNRLPRAYHSGDHAEIDWILRRLRLRHERLHVSGVSLGGNALLRWAQEAGHQAGELVRSLAAICAPIDLAASGHAMGRGVNRWTYTLMFLRTMKHRAGQMWQRHPGLFDLGKMQRARTLYDFDNVFTAPLHGFANTEDYWQRASAKPGMRTITCPSLIIHARNDPFVPAHSWPQADQVSPSVVLCQTDTGGHVGFLQGPPPGRLQDLPEYLMQWWRLNP